MVFRVIRRVIQVIRVSRVTLSELPTPSISQLVGPFRFINLNNPNNPYHPTLVKALDVLFILHADHEQVLQAY